MNHLDEGTIHAWIDGALDASQSRDIENHVAQCATCGAAVAEARGLVAGASRILMALDDVPAGVTPQSVAAPKRNWLAAPWVTGIAAALILAVGLTTWSRSRDSITNASSNDAVSQSVAPQREQHAPTPTPTIASAPAVADSAVNRSGSGSSAATRLREETSTRGRQPRASEPLPGKCSAQRAASLEKAEDRAPSSVAASPLSDAEAAKVTEAEQRSANAVGAVSRADSASTVLRRTLGARPLERIVITGAPPAAAPSPAITSIPRAPLGAMTDVERSVGCYRVAVSDVERFARDVKAIADQGRAATRRAAPPSAAAAPSAGAVFSSGPLLVRLDSDSVPYRGAHKVFAASSDSVLGTWNPTAGDSVRVDLRTSGIGIFVFATKNRVECPQSR